MFQFIDQLSSVIFPLRLNADTESPLSTAPRRGPAGSDHESSHANAWHVKPTELHRTAVRELKTHFSALWRQTTFGIAIVNFEGRILDGNPQLWAMLNRIPAVGPQLLADHFLPEHAQSLEQLIRCPTHAAHLAESHSAIVCTLPGPGVGDLGRLTRPRWMRLKVISRLTHSLAISVEDVSEVIQLHHENQVIHEQLRHIQRLELVSEWSAGMAHEFNNLLQIVEAYSAIIKRDRACSGAIDKSIDEILVSVRRGSALIKRLLAFSRKSTVQFRNCDLVPFVSRCLGICRHILGARVKIECRSPAEPVHCRMDETLIEQALLNLCINARDAMPGGGQIRIELHAVKLDDCVIRSTPLKAGNYAQISVTDSGVGIPAEMQVKIFEPFFTTKKVGSGTGLGLSLVRGIVRDHGGAIDVQSSVGHGSTFTIYLPLAAPQG